jgi:hypothetical protein
MAAFHNTIAVVALATVAIVSAPAPAAAQQQPGVPGPGQPGLEAPLRPKLGIGFQSSWPSYGVSGIYDLNPTVSGQAVVGFLGGWTTLSARGLYRVAQRPHIDPYGYGMAGMWRYDSGLSDASAFTFGGGGGLDIDLRLLAPDLPPLYFNMELGLSMVNLELAGYNGAMMAFGAGFHYRF